MEKRRQTADTARASSDSEVSEAAWAVHRQETLEMKQVELAAKRQECQNLRDHIELTKAEQNMWEQHSGRFAYECSELANELQQSRIHVDAHESTAKAEKNLCMSLKAALHVSEEEVGRLRQTAQHDAAMVGDLQQRLRAALLQLATPAAAAATHLAESRDLATSMSCPDYTIEIHRQR